MDTKPLERFATWARRELLSVVDAQASTVLADGSVPRTEHPETVRRLESQIENHGRQHIIDKVAHTWFNRIIALRFMDVRGYNGAGIVSPVQGQEDGQPEILSDAKRGNLDSDVITSNRTEDAILGLIDGTRYSTDAEGEAYAILLTQYCRYWHKFMPFMFEREGDYTELLVPANLLADGALLSRVRKVLTQEVCEDVEVIGWLYQFYISERKEEVFAGFKQNKKAGADELPAATQLFTPHWIVRYLVENSIGRLWMLNRPESRLIDQMDYYIAPLDDGTDFLKISGPEDLTVIDPACGSGHMLTYAFDLLYAIYEEEGYAPSDIPGLILSNNLYGTEIDPRAGALAAFALTMKARAKQRTFFNRRIQPQICVIEPIFFTPNEIDWLTAEQSDEDVNEEFFNHFEQAETLGSLIQPDAQQTMRLRTMLEKTNVEEDILYTGTLDRAQKLVHQAEILSNWYTVVVTNPPYMGSNNMNGCLSEFAKDSFPNSKSDLFAMFIERAIEMITPRGYMAQVTMQSWMFLSSFDKLRKSLALRTSIESLLHMDNMVMRIAFGTNATVWKVAGSPENSGSFTYIEMSDLDDENIPTKFPADNLRNRGAGGSFVFRHSMNDFNAIPGSPIAYWLSEPVREVFHHEPLARIFSTRLGLSTANNDRFLRYWWEVSNNRVEYGSNDRHTAELSKMPWFPYQKGGAFRKWYGNLELLVNWERDGYEIRNFADERTGRIRSHNYNLDYIFQPGITWTDITSAENAFRVMDRGQLFDGRGSSGFANSEKQLPVLLGVLNSTSFRTIKTAINPTLSLNVGEVARTPLPDIREEEAKNIASNVKILEATSRDDWNSTETSWDFIRPSWLGEGCASLAACITEWSHQQRTTALEQKEREAENNRFVAELYGLENEVPVNVTLSKVSLTRNVEFRYGPGKTAEEYTSLERADVATELVSYAVGCIFGRYSLDEPGLILANQGEQLRDYLAKVPEPTFTPDADNVIPVVDDGWFKDDIVERFREFLRVTFGAEHFEENLRFVEESLGVRTLRDYFITKNGKSKFYEEHVKRYKKRPIYWMFSSPKGSFNALIYMHRYTPSTVSTVLNEYLREYRSKLEVALTDAENAATGGSAKDQKEADRLRRVLVELAEYEHDVLYPLATRQLPINLDDGVLVNYLRFGRALKNIGLENNRNKVEGWDWPTNKLEPL